MSHSSAFVPTKRTALRRLPKRGVYQRNRIYDILDEGFVCHIGFAIDGEPVVIPMAYGRTGNVLYIHGSVASRLLRALVGEIHVCVTVTLLDGLVLARSAFHHAMNYRSVVAFGTAFAVKDRRKKVKALRAFSEHIMPGRWEDVRKPNDTELEQTLVLELPLTEASAKIRTGPPIDEPGDYNLSVWAGELPLSLVASEPIPDARLLPGIKIPAYIQPAKVRCARVKQR